jgi:hypothetical protein
LYVRAYHFLPLVIFTVTRRIKLIYDVCDCVGCIVRLSMCELSSSLLIAKSRLTAHAGSPGVSVIESSHR